MINNLHHVLTRISAAGFFRDQIGRFFQEYLFSGDAPVPFAGRNDELTRLDHWLDDAAAPSRLIVTAPAGRGKSALLVRWVERLYATGELTCRGAGAWKLVFLPVSSRFGLNSPDMLVRALAERLAAIHSPGELIERPVFEAASFYAGKVQELLQAIAVTSRVLVVVDGLDEALGGAWTSPPFAAILPSNVRLVVSARWQPGDSDGRAWLDRFGWREGEDCVLMELAPLNETAIVQLLTRTEGPISETPQPLELAHVLFELTEGEPLLLRYYAEELRRMATDTASLTPELAASFPRGFSAYFERCLEHYKTALRKAAGWRSQPNSLRRRAGDPEDG